MADHARGERLRQLRSQRGLSQEDVAHALGVTAKTYGTWEKGGGIRAQNARLIARYFKVKPAELVAPEFGEPPALDGNLPLAMQNQLDHIEAMLLLLLEAQGITDPLDDVPAGGPLKSGVAAERTSPKAAKPKAGRSRSARRPSS